MALALARDTQVPPFFIPRDDEASTQASPQSPREVISGDVVYRLGGQFWPSRCFMKLEGDLLIIERSSKQEAAVQLSGASVELQGTCSIKLEAPSTPVLVLRWECEEETMRWFQHLEAATHQSRSARDVLREVPLLSPRSEAAGTPTTLKELLKEMELSQQAESARADTAEKALKEQKVQRQKLEKAILEEQEKQKQAEMTIKELEKRLAKESLVAKEKDQKTEAKIKELEERLAKESSVAKELEARLAKESLVAKEQQEQAEVAEAQIKELQAKIDEQSSLQEDAQSEVHLLQQRLARTEQRLLGQEQWRKVAEESRLGAECRLQEMEEMLTKRTEKLALSRV